MKTKKNQYWRDHDKKEKRKKNNHSGVNVLPQKAIVRTRKRYV